MRYSTTRPTAPTEAHGCEQLAQSCYSTMHRPGVEPATLPSHMDGPSGVYRNLKKEVLGVHFEKCSNFSIIFFTLKISTNIFSPPRGAGTSSLSTPLHGPGNWTLTCNKKVTPLINVLPSTLKVGADIFYDNVPKLWTYYIRTPVSELKGRPNS